MTLSQNPAIAAARVARIPVAIDSLCEYRKTSAIAGAVRVCARAEPCWGGLYRLELSAGVAQLVLIDRSDGDPPVEIAVSAEVLEALRGV